MCSFGSHAFEENRREGSYQLSARNPWTNIAVHFSHEYKMHQHSGQRSNRNHRPHVLPEHPLLLTQSDITCDCVVQGPNMNLSEIPGHRMILQAGKQHQSEELRLTTERIQQ